MFSFFSKLFGVKTVLKAANPKPLSETGIIMTTYINVAGLSKTHAEQQIQSIIENYRITDEDVKKMGVRFVKQFYYPVGVESEPNSHTRVEVVLV